MKAAPWCVAVWALVGAVALAQPTPPSRVEAAPSVQAAPTWPSALDAAWARAVAAGEAAGAQRRAAAQQVVASRWLASPPMVALSQREGVGNSASGSSETELAVALPLWRLGQREAAGGAAQAEQDWARAQARWARWRLAGQLRDAAGAWEQQDDELRLAQHQAQWLLRLSDDVAKRVAAGELAPADGLAARAEWLGAQGAVVEARNRVQAAQALWQQLTGLAQRPIAADEGGLATGLAIRAATGAETGLVNEPAVTTPLAHPGPPGPEMHPERALARATLARARQRLTVVERQGGGGAELSLQLRQERPGQGGAAQYSAGVGVRWPWGGSQALAVAPLAEAWAEWDVAQLAQQRTDEAVDSGIALAQAQRAAAQQQLVWAQERAALLRQRAEMIDKAFRVGEASLPEVLRAWGLAAQADLEVTRQRGAVRLTLARLEHAKGQLP